MVEDEEVDEVEAEAAMVTGTLDETVAAMAALGTDKLGPAEVDIIVEEVEIVEVV